MTPSQPRLRGSWAGLNWSHTAAHLYRAVLEGVALEYCLYRDVLQALNPELTIREVRITGGGEKSALWNQIKADALRTRRRADQRGAKGRRWARRSLAGYGVGLFDDLDAAAATWIKHRQTRAARTGRSRAHYRMRVGPLPAAAGAAADSGPNPAMEAEP